MSALSEGLQDMHFGLMTGIEELQTAMTAFFCADEPTEEQIGSVEYAAESLIHNLSQYRDAVGDEFPTTEDHEHKEVSRDAIGLEATNDLSHVRRRTFRIARR